MKEVYSKEVIESGNFLIVYSFTDEIFYLEDFYIRSEFRDNGFGKELMETIISMAKVKGCKKLLGSVSLLCKYKDENMAKFLKFGFKLESLGSNIIFLMKDI
jgi:GNAT superfamily N-acetyltransferase